MSRMCQGTMSNLCLTIVLLTFANQIGVSYEHPVGGIADALSILWVRAGQNFIPIVVDANGKFVGTIPTGDLEPPPVQTTKQSSNVGNLPSVSNDVPANRTKSSNTNKQTKDHAVRKHTESATSFFSAVTPINVVLPSKKSAFPKDKIVAPLTSTYSTGKDIVNKTSSSVGHGGMEITLTGHTVEIAPWSASKSKAAIIDSVSANIAGTPEVMPKDLTVLSKPKVTKVPAAVKLTQSVVNSSSQASANQATAAPPTTTTTTATTTQNTTTVPTEAATILLTTVPTAPPVEAAEAPEGPEFTTTPPTTPNAAQLARLFRWMKMNGGEMPEPGDVPFFI